MTMAAESEMQASPAAAVVLRMNPSREGETSYVNNSSFQRAIASATRKARRDMAAALYRARGQPASMAIADLGCATGPNALLMVTDAVEAVMAECGDEHLPAPELLVFLNDLPGNDFNAVFRLLPTSPLAASGCCSVSAWPGSFYGRIFPEASLDYVVSSSSLHFLSKVYAAPDVLNRGRVYISEHSSAATLDAYRAQFQSDFSAFLRCRSPEMRPGGLVLLTFVARRTTFPTAHDCYLWDLLADALMDMAAAGLVDEEQVHAFNAPFYSPSADDLLHVIRNEGSFAVRTMQLFEVTRRHLISRSTKKDDDDGQEEEELSRRLAVETVSTVRAVVEPMMRTQFGSGAIMDALFCRYSLLLEAYYRSKATQNKDEVTNVFLALEKKHHN